MEFKDKLSFLMQITDVSGLELANYSGITKSAVSLYRSGKRKMPKNPEILQAFADFFSKKLTSEYQKQALAEFSNNEFIINTKENITISNAVFSWLSGTKPDPSHVVNSFVSTLSPDNIPKVHSTNPFEPVAEHKSAHIASRDALSQVYFGTAGKREAFYDILTHLLSVAHPGIIYISIDDSAEWFFSDPDLPEKLPETLSILIKRGFRVVHILPPPSISHYFDTLEMWTPLYLTGKVMPYYYPRFRDNIFRGSFVALENEIALASVNVLSSKEAGLCTVSVDHTFIADIIRILRDYQNMCRPALHIYAGQKAMDIFYTIICNSEDDFISQRCSLPMELIPEENHQYYLNTCIDEEMRNLAELLYSTMRKRTHSSTRSVTTIGYIASANQVRAGTVPMIIPGIQPGYWQPHTPETYSRHLKAILDWLDESENHHFIPMEFQLGSSGSMLVRHNKHAIVSQDKGGFTVYEITEPSLVQACEEYLLRKLDTVNYVGIGKTQIRKQLEDLIQELENPE